MSWKKWMNGWRNGLMIALVVSTTGHVMATATSTSTTPVTPANPAPAKLPPVHKIKAIDCDNHTVVINRPGLITLLLGTDEDSQDAARQAGDTMDPLRGRPDFQLVVVVDLRNSIAAWVPSVVIGQMRSNLDKQAPELKPYFLKNGNKSNPRTSSHVIADFTGTICPQLGWPDHSDDLRGILFGADGREIKRWQKLDDMHGLLVDVWAAIQALDDAQAAKAKAEAVAAAKTESTRQVQPSTPAPPLPPIPPPTRSR